MARSIASSYINLSADITFDLLTSKWHPGCTCHTIVLSIVGLYGKLCDMSQPTTPTQPSIPRGR